MDSWEDTPGHYIQVDVRSLLQDAAITEVLHDKCVRIYFINFVECVKGMGLRLKLRLTVDIL